MDIEYLAERPEFIPTLARGTIMSGRTSGRATRWRLASFDYKTAVVAGGFR